MHPTHRALLHKLSIENRLQAARDANARLRATLATYRLAHAILDARASEAARTALHAHAELAEFPAPARTLPDPRAHTTTPELPA